MNSRERRIAALTRSRDFLWRVAIALGILFTAIAWIGNRISRPDDRAAAGGTPGIASLLTNGLAEALEPAPGADGGIDREAVLAWIQAVAAHRSLLSRDRATSEAFIGEATSQLLDSPLEKAEARLFADFLTAVAGPPEAAAAASEAIARRASETDAPPHANRIHAALLQRDGRRDDAMAAFLREVELHDSDPARQGALWVAVRDGDRGKLDTLLADPRFEATLDPQLQRAVGVVRRDVLAILASHLRAWPASLDAMGIVLALTAAAVWLIIVLQAAGLPPRSAAWAIPAFALGVASIFLTLVLVTLQEEIVGLQESGDVVNDFVYFAAGVGLREEASKLALFALMLPVLRRAGADAALAAACAAWVGLGFALEENIGYFRNFGEVAVWSRFLTANFLHLTTTGIAGVALWRLVDSRGRAWEGFVAAFLGVVGIHAAYDLVLSNPTLGGELWFLHIAAIAVLAWWFFGMIHAVRRPVRLVVSPLAVFVIGSGIILGIALCAALWDRPFTEGFADFGKAAVSIAPVAFIFAREFEKA